MEVINEWQMCMEKVLHHNWADNCYVLKQNFKKGALCYVGEINVEWNLSFIIKFDSITMKTQSTYKNYDEYTTIKLYKYE